MKFEKSPLRHVQRSFEDRHRATFDRKQTRECARLPLLAEHVREQQRSWDDEQARRQASDDAFVCRQRNLEAKFWRKGRAAYFALPAEARTECRAYWDAWRGPAKGTNLIYVVERFNGVGEAREAMMREDSRAMDRRITERLQAQQRLL